MDEEFTTTAYPNVQENLKIPTEGEVRLEELASSTGTLSSMQNLDKELSFTNQFLAEKSQEDEPEKTNTELEVQSMVMVPIHQDTSSVPLMTSPIIDLTVSQPASTTIIIKRIDELERCIANLVEENQTLEERLDKQGNRIHQLETQDLSIMIKEQTVEYIDKQEIDQKIEETVKEVVTASVINGDLTNKSMTRNSNLFASLHKESPHTYEMKDDSASKYGLRTLYLSSDDMSYTGLVAPKGIVQRTPQQNGVVEKKDRSLVKAARTMLTFANLPLCYLLNDYDDVGKLKGKGILECLLDIQKNMLHSEFTISVLERFTRA
ncbi:hypothetical protein Tco_0232569 [Tanacetum coccineum]